MNRLFLKQIFLLLMTIFVISGCSDSKLKPLTKPPTSPDGSNGSSSSPAAPSLSTDSAPSPGTGSGGGGYDDGAKRLISAAVRLLTNMLKNASPVHFEQFPEGWTQERMIEVIQNIEFKDENIVRDQEALLFDYDISTSKLFFTKRFVEKYGQNKFTQASGGDLNELKEVSLQILHEFSHLLGIGQSLIEDKKSELFAVAFLDNLLTETRICSGEHHNKPLTLIINPPTKMTFAVSGKSRQNFHGVLGESLYLGNEVYEWELSYPFSYFDSRASEQISTAALNMIFEQGELRNTIPLRSPYDLIDTHEFNTLSTEAKEHIFFWPQEGPYTFSYQQTFLSVDEENIEGKLMTEIGQFELLPNSLKYEVSYNDQINEEESFNIEMECDEFATPFELLKIRALDATSDNFQTEANNEMLKISLNRIYQYYDCENKNDQFEINYCKSLELKINRN